jgi:hypothetical protein
MQHCRSRLGAVSALTALTIAVAGCIRTVDLGTTEVARDMREQTVLRSAGNLPDAFTIVTPPAVAGDCPVRLRDDTVGAELHLQRSMLLPAPDERGGFQAFGDYRVTPAGHYGDVRPGDGLRVDCRRLRALGVVTLGVPGGDD